MFPIRRLLTTTTAALLLCASGVQAQTAAQGSGLPSSADIVAWVLRTTASYARLVVDIRYGAIETDDIRNSLMIRDLEINGLGQMDRCRVQVSRLGISGISLWGQENSQARFDFGDLSVANNCFGPNAAMIGAVTGQQAITFTDLSVDIQQHFGSGAMIADLQAVSPGLARIEGAVDFDYVALSFPDLLTNAIKNAGGPDEGMPEQYQDPDADPDFDPDAVPGDDPGPGKAGLRGELRAAHLTVEDLGAWARLSPLAPPQAIEPATIDGLVSAQPGTPLHAIQQDMADALKAFVAQPGTITAEIRPEAPVPFDTTEWTTPDDAAAILTPLFSNAVPTPPLPLIADVTASDDPRAMGLALAQGAGVPQNRQRAIELLSPMQDDGEIALALAELQAVDDPAAAYAHAMAAASAGTDGALSALDRIERRMPTKDLLAAQPAADAPIDDAAFASVAALRTAALAAEDGDGTARSYAQAWRLAALAAGAGDSPSRSLMDRLNARFGDDPDWRAARDKASDLALSDWSSRKLAEAFAGE